MTGKPKSRILIVGAGALGVAIGYVLSVAGVEVTFLIRPHRKEAMDRPQTLYCYTDNKLKVFKDYGLITDPAEMMGKEYDYIIVTLDGAALMNQVGQDLTKTIGQACKGTKTKVILSTVFFEVKPWFLKMSGLSVEQVATAGCVIHVYATKAVTLPLNPPTDPALLAQSDWAYTDCLGAGFMIENTTPALAEDFAAIYNASGISFCALMDATDLAMFSSTLFPLLAVWDLLGWPKFSDINTKGELWKLGSAAAKEIQTLSVHGEKGQQAAAAASEDTFAATFADIDSKMAPMDWGQFNRYHHGAKVNSQDRKLLRACLEYGEDEGKSMSALKALIQRVEQH